MKQALLLLSIVALCYSCTHTDSSSSTSRQTSVAEDSTNLHVALMPTLGCMPFYYAEKVGIYDKLGLKLTLLSFDSQMDCDTAFTRGHAQVAYTDLPRALMMKKNGNALYSIMQIPEEWQLIATNNKRIRNLKQLKERMVGVARHSTSDFWSDALMDSAHLQVADIFRPQINDILLRTQMVGNSTLDAALLPQPYADVLSKNGHKCLFTNRQDSLPQFTTLVMSDKAWKKDNRRQQVRLLLQGYNQAIQALNQNMHADTIRHLLVHTYQLLPSQAESISLPKYTAARAQQYSHLEQAVQWLQKREQLTATFPTDSLIRNELTQ